MDPTTIPDDNRGPGLVAAAWAMGFAGCCLLALRMYSRVKIIKRTGLDDWTMVIAVILALVTNIIVTLMVHHGVGRHTMHLGENQRANAVYMIWLSVPFSPGSAAFGKVSIALLLIRLMNRNKVYEAFLWVLIFLLFAITLVLVIITFAQCTPVTFLWDRVRVPPPSGNCWDPAIQQNFGYFQGAFSAASDLFLALFPILIMWDLQMPLRVKAGICFLMSLGVVATAAAAMKTVELRNLATPDFTWDAVPLVYWFLAENWIIIICACVPTIRPIFSGTEWRVTDFFSRMTDKAFGSWVSSSRHSTKMSSQQTDYKLENMETPLYKRIEGSSVHQLGDVSHHDAEMIDPGKHGITKTTNISVV